MGIWKITYRMRRESFPRVFEISVKSENLESGAKEALAKFKATFQEDIDRKNIEDITVLYCFEYGKVSSFDLASDEIKDQPLF